MYKGKDWSLVLRAKLDRYTPPPVTLTVDGLFENAPEGDFSWEDTEPGDTYAWACDCPAKWHRALYYVNMGRKDGKRYIDVLCDTHADGDAQPYIYWEDGLDPTEALTFIAHSNDKYFISWAEYWLDCYHTGKDPLNQMINGRLPTPAECLVNAGVEIKYLFMNKDAKHEF